MVDSFVGRVACWEEQVTIPTYGIGKPDKNPMFLEKRVYQGSSGVVYPHPIVDSVETEKHDKTYNAVFLENQYLKIMLLPELGGRVQMALDKTNGYHFVYYNRVIKPALVGLAGPWISGGIEFNWPQHHRPSTFESVDFLLEENADGSKTVWFNEIERMFRTKGMVGFTLHPDTAYLKLDVQLYNRTDKPQTFLWWANPAVHVNDDYQSVFPPDVHAVMDHGKRAVSDFPIATGTYYKMDYSPGTDISRYKNIPVPTSFMAYHSDFDFIGCYDHGRQAGMMHVANHHLVPGKKQWTWGNGDFGLAWDKQLTDADGPYIELMCGAFTDNQPDFSWLQPGEEKQFTQIFMPYKSIGAAKNASEDCVLNLDIAVDQVIIGVYVTCPREVNIQVCQQDRVIYETRAELSPETAFTHHVPLETPSQNITLTVSDTAGNTLLSYTPQPDEKPDIPDPAIPAPDPMDVASNEQLFLHGLHLEQYRHATYAPEPYYEEALQRDPGDSRCNNAMGLLLLRRGKFAEAEDYFRRAVARVTLRNPNPYDGEPYYNLGKSLCMQGNFDEAYDAFYKAVWNAGTRAAAYFELARIACRRGKRGEAINLCDATLDNNPLHHQARHLKTACLRWSEQIEAAQAEIEQGLKRDRFNFGLRYEQGCLERDYVTSKQLMRGWVHNYIEIALDYAHAGLFEDALTLLQMAPSDDPMVMYYAAWCSMSTHDTGGMADYLDKAAAMSPAYCNPNRVEAVTALTLAIEHNPNDAHAPYYLGNFWYAHRRYDEAIGAWEMACKRDSGFSTPFRNLGLAYMNKRRDADHARKMYETAFQLDPTDARVLFEMDQLYKKMGVAPTVRLQTLEQHRTLVEQRDDLYLERVTLLNILGRHEDALDSLMGHTFHPWEGGEGKVAEQYVLSLIQLARHDIAAGRYTEAINRLNHARTYPDNLNEGKLAGDQENHINYYLGIVHDALGKADQARDFYERASIGASEPTSAMYYNDQPPEMIFYQGLAREKLGQSNDARSIFSRLVAYGREHSDDDIKMDYFAVSLPNFLVFEDDLTLRNRIHCHYMMALGYLGLCQDAEARSQFEVIDALEPNHIGAAAHRDLVNERKNTDKQR